MTTHLTTYFDLEMEEPADDGHFDDGRDSRFRAVVAWLIGTLPGRLTISMLGLSILAAMSTVVTGALLTDQVSMATVTAVGGTLDIVINGDVDDQAVAFGGAGATIVTNVSNMAPGDIAWGELAIANAGTLPLTINVNSSGTDTHPDQAVGHCFSYFLREVGGSGATSNGATLAAPTLLTNMGSAEAPDTQTALFETPTTQQLTDVAASADNVWEVDDVKTYRLTVRMRTECTQGGQAGPGATGSLTLTFNAVQT